MYLPKAGQSGTIFTASNRKLVRAEPFLLQATESWSGWNPFFTASNRRLVRAELFLLHATESWSGQPFFTASNRKLVRAWEQSNLHTYIHNQFLLEIFLCGLDNFHTLKILLFADLFLSFSCRFCTENNIVSLHYDFFSCSIKYNGYE